MVSTCWIGRSQLTNNLVTMEFADARYKRTWPAGNLFIPDSSGIGFANLGTEGGDYHLVATSPFKNAGTDGKDLGADVDAVMGHIEGVR